MLQKLAKIFKSLHICRPGYILLALISSFLTRAKSQDLQDRSDMWQ